MEKNNGMKSIQQLDEKRKSLESQFKSLLKEVRSNNDKSSIQMYLDAYKNLNLELSILEKELDELELKLNSSINDTGNDHTSCQIYDFFDNNFYLN